MLVSTIIRKLTPETYKKSTVMKHFTLLIAAVMALCSESFAQTVRTKYINANAESINIELLRQRESPVQMSRILLAGYNTICMPMTLNADQLQTAAPGARVERLAAMRQEGNTVNLFFIDCTADGIEAGVPYLIYTPKTQFFRAKSNDAIAVNTELKDITMSDAHGNRVIFGSSWNTLKTYGRYGIPAKQDKEILESVLIRTNGEQSFLPTRCGFTWEAQAPAAMELKINHISALSEIADGIEGLKANNALVDIYDANGILVRKHANINKSLRNLPRGIYFIGNEKVAVK